MAKAQKIRAQVVTVTETVKLELSMHEAEVLAVILGHVAGDVTDSPRKHQSAISTALHAAGVRASWNAGLIASQLGISPERRHVRELLSGAGVIFKNYPSHWTESDRG